MDLATADRLGSVMGAIGGLIGLMVSVWALAGSHSVLVKAQGGAVASGGHVGRIITGHGNRATHPVVPRPSAPASTSVHASGAGSTAAAGDIGEVITGDENRT
ncbi:MULTISPECIES: hypothetical protein [unclassified Streptomyces]|uniref:hypothetical protein n=1 Tax=unclassified Streptomyces TaxID=2593676 RepID=UPI003660B5B5